MKNIFCFYLLSFLIFGLFCAEVDIEVVRKALLDRSNYYRKLHCAPEQKFNTKLTEIAQEWAEY
ncbi:MAG: hypothetical protein MJ252_02030 [archaeon]|nr:hypothetical protein [archaeon]